MRRSRTVRTRSASTSSHSTTAVTSDPAAAGRPVYSRALISVNPARPISMACAMPCGGAHGALVKMPTTIANMANIIPATSPGRAHSTTFLLAARMCASVSIQCDAGSSPTRSTPRRSRPARRPRGRMVTRVTDSGARGADAVDVAGAGDEVVADEIVDLQPGLYRFARSLTGDPDEASDLAQEATARALGALRSFTPGTNLRAWLFRILRNTYLNRRRAVRLHPAPVPLETAPDNAGLADGRRAPVEHDVLVRAELRAVLDAFSGLPERYATPLYLTAVEERSYAEVARELGIPIGTVMSRIYRARQLLLSRLAEERR